MQTSDIHRLNQDDDFLYFHRFYEHLTGRYLSGVLLRLKTDQGSTIHMESKMATKYGRQSISIPCVMTTL